ncbi:bifunctional folylpolyglutamate synthase/dihydrofolate synthase [Listeria booriae]|uniref:bifunctional folylpolyglutamate synthase/dihydrofolate synthase n=1 Tax=Listeria booriae TaxID=1552123 RepID=UPI001625540F|nr:folylpolyglutamate synthase/dihydrofolate synthase family protein [Listeria booriae]MBC1511650.1 bifunctional folylpolyglutamate synthase/dihydrofolate synthase [Listeria booriae]MBC6150447.1 bifunctional folylpolyglutamate synthase/dihydrofolate synthase [Listeria booriae]MBC6304696.1 bifunctional folylpolyglutamate synthase/dihydrofolate synthase [Listeria booriae]
MGFKDYESAISWIHGTLRMGIKPGLQRMEWMLAKLDNPQNKNKWVHIAGTNGKGSTVTFIRNILENAGYRVGTFTSPYIEQFNERICIDGTPISDEAIISLCNQIKPLADELGNESIGHPSEFEIITVMMFLYFADYASIDIGIVEVGLGGRLDSTNVITPLVSVITTIGMDHMEFLGNTIESIASEKAGIMKPGVPVVSGVLQPEVRTLYKKRADEMNLKIFQLERNFHVEILDGQQFNYLSSHTNIDSLEVGLIGDHQLNNAAVAIQTTELLNQVGFITTEENIRIGLKNASWPGRMENVHEKPTIYLDGAHNIEGIKALVNTTKRFPDQPVKLLFTAMRDKEFVDMIALLKQINHVDIYITTFDYPRALTKDEVQKIAIENNISVASDWEKWLISERQKSDAIILVTGSLYFISEVRKFLLS